MKEISTKKGFERYSFKRNLFTRNLFKRSLSKTNFLERNLFEKLETPWPNWQNYLLACPSFHGQVDVLIKTPYFLRNFAPSSNYNVHKEATPTRTCASTQWSCTDCLLFSNLSYFRYTIKKKSILKLII